MVRLIGVDFATQDKKVGLACADHTDGKCTVLYAKCASKEASAAKIIEEWIGDRAQSALLAIDAPLGWPARLSSVLIGHSAGQQCGEIADRMFFRDTDRFVRSWRHKAALAVGADKIARTSHSALDLLGTLRQRLELEIPLAWSPEVNGVAAIEVYPAATLSARGMWLSGYKGKKSRPDKPNPRVARQKIVSFIVPLIGVDSVRGQLEANDDVLDAAVCVLAAKDFIEAKAIGPSNLDVAKREGWIWSVGPDGTQPPRSQ